MKRTERGRATRRVSRGSPDAPSGDGSPNRSRIAARALAAGAPADAHDCYPIGNEMGPLASASRKKFTGHERDEETGVDYMLARYHRASMKRFLSVDPWFDVQPEKPQWWNSYGCVRNDPINGVDPEAREDLRTDDEKTMMADSDVPVPMGQASFGAEDGAEWGCAAECDEHTVARSHAHRDWTIRNSDGTTSYADPDEASRGDEENAASTKRTRRTQRGGK